MANELWIYDVVGEGYLTEGVTAKSVRDDLAKLDRNQPLELRINSPGGDVFEAVAINSLIAGWPGGVHVTVDGLAASAASYIATSGDTVTMAEGSMMMLHMPWTLALGNADTMREAAEMLDKVAGNLVTAYQRKSGQDAERIEEIMRAETWLTAAEAIELGLADRSAETTAKACVVSREFSYRNTPQHPHILREDAPAVCVKGVPVSVSAMRRKLDLLRNAM